MTFLNIFGTSLTWSSLCGGEIFRTRPDRPWGPPGLLYNGYRVFPGYKAFGSWRWSSTSSCAELYLYYHSGLSCSVRGWPLPLLSSSSSSKHKTEHHHHQRKEKQSHYRPWQALRASGDWGPRFQGNRHMKVARLLALLTGRLYPSVNIPGTHFC
jgi:hypothetical protein